MKRITVFALLSGALGLPAVAQDTHVRHAIPETPPPSSPAAANPHAGHQMSPAADDSMGDMATAIAQPVGNALPPAVIRDSAADRVYGAAPMGRARNVLADEHGGEPNSKVMANILEYTEADDGSGYRWDVEAWYGGDINRFVLKTEGEGVRGDGVSGAETQALYSRAVGRYTDVQAGVRYDLEPDSRTYATVAVESLFPYWLEVEASLFLSDRGDVFGRIEGIYDLRLTQRLILQPRIELELAAQNVPEVHIGSGLSSAEFGLRLRYDIRREFAPYLGVNFEKNFGQTADFVRATGVDDEDASVVIGLRAWF